MRSVQRAPRGAPRARKNDRAGGGGRQDWGAAMNELPAVVPFVPLPTMSRLLLALAVGPFVGLEREHRGKEAGLRTFGFAALLGSLGGLLGEPYALLCLGFLGVLIAFLNLQALRANQGAELTTSAALLVTGLCGVLCGVGHTFTTGAAGLGALAASLTSAIVTLPLVLRASGEPRLNRRIALALGVILLARGGGDPAARVEPVTVPPSRSDQR